MNAKISAFVICVEVIIYLLLYNLDDCTFNNQMKFLLFCPVLSYLRYCVIKTNIFCNTCCESIDNKNITVSQV